MRQLFLLVVRVRVPFYASYNHQVIGFRQSVNNRTQKESPCRIPCFSCIGPILSFFSMILTSGVMDHFFTVFVINLVIFAGMLCICSVRASHLWLIESTAFFTSIHVHERFLLLLLLLLLFSFCSCVQD